MSGHPLFSDEDKLHEQVLKVYEVLFAALWHGARDDFLLRDQALAIKEHDSFKPNPVLLRAQTSAFDS